MEGEGGSAARGVLRHTAPHTTPHTTPPSRSSRRNFSHVERACCGRRERAVLCVLLFEVLCGALCGVVGRGRGERTEARVVCGDLPHLGRGEVEVVYLFYLFLVLGKFCAGQVLLGGEGKKRIGEHLLERGAREREIICSCRRGREDLAPRR